MYASLDNTLMFYLIVFCSGFVQCFVDLVTLVSVILQSASSLHKSGNQ